MQPCAISLPPPPPNTHLLTHLLIIHLPRLSLPSRCASCWPPAYSRVFDWDDCFYVAEVRVEDPDVVFGALARAIDALIAAVRPGEPI